MELTTTPNPASLIEKAIESNLDIDKLERLMDLQERWEANNAKKAYFEAMNKFQEKKPEIIKSENVEFNGKKQFSFASLSNIQKLVDPVLSEYGLSYSWKQEKGDGEKNIKITCIVSHVDGHSELTDLEGGHDTSGSKNSIQAIGSAVSYLKRYTLMNALGLSTGDDNGASTQMSSEEINQLMLEKLSTLIAEKTVPKEMLDRVNEIIKNKESSSYKKAIKTIEKL
jgi:hypothetical protein